MEDYAVDHSERRQGETSRTWERHIQSVLLAMVLSVMLWVGSSVLAANIHLAQIDERISTLQSQIVATYRTADAQRDVAEASRQIETLKQRVSTVEQSINGRKTTPELQQWSKK
jgi:peptidoglycan hydrolase CwlO-like protein